jgi:hypothetical protein
VSKRLEYKVLKVSSEELETTLNIYAQDGYRAVHFFPPGDQGEVAFVISRKQKMRKQHHEVFEKDDL